VSVATRVALAAYVPTRTFPWPDYSHLFVVGDEFGWSIDDDATRLAAAARRLGFETAPSRWARFAKRQSVFQPDHFGALRARWLESTHRLGLSYFHGRPGTPGYPEFDEAYATLRRHAGRIERVQVTHAEMHDLVLDAGVEPARVFRIPIGVDPSAFTVADAAGRSAARLAFGLPDSAFVVGSFQKDGVGLDAGREPKLVKGPDVLVETLARLQERVPELAVLLTGLARGYVLEGLRSAGVPCSHVLLSSRQELARAYHALDAYVVPSRQEGGPKGVLEAMAAGVPVATTRVGQAPDVVDDGRNGLLVDVEDVDALVAALERVHGDAELRGRMRTEGRATAEMYADERLDGRWAELLEGFVGAR
jgi:glycosyltransferase involved in cell wall biosynthesis